MDRTFRAIGLDMDGTLLDTRVDYSKMSDLLFDEMVRMGVPENVLDRSGGSKFNIESGTQYLIERGREKDLWDMQVRINKAATAIEMENVHAARPFPGAIEVLNELREEGVPIGVLTRGSREYATAALKTAGVWELINSLVCRDDHPEKEAKPSPMAMQHLAKSLGTECSHILYLGDHRFDHDCAISSGAGFIAVLTGTYDEEDWRELGNGFPIIPSITELRSQL
ncbi:MAG: HAD family hydrolase [Candidatus Methanomethylophilaceae archaeon]